MKTKLIISGVSLIFLGCASNTQPLVNTSYQKQPVINMQVNCQQPKKSVKQPKAAALSPNNAPENKVCFITNTHSKKCILSLEATGIGVVPCNGACSTAQAKAMARRAAIVDAYKVLAEKMYGIQIKGRDTVKNMILQNSTLRSYVSGLIRNAEIVEEDFKDGTYKVVLSVKLNPYEWNKYIENYPYTYYN